MYRPPNCLIDNGIWLESSRGEHGVFLESPALLEATSFFPPVELISNNFNYAYGMATFDESSLSSPSSSFGSLNSESSVSSPTCQFDTSLLVYRNINSQEQGDALSFPIKPKIHEKNFDCHICSRSFSRKYDLQRHIRVHTGDKPYMCLSCTKPFARTDALKRHLRIEEKCKSSSIIQVMKASGNRRYQDL